MRLSDHAKFVWLGVSMQNSDHSITYKDCQLLYFEWEYHWYFWFPNLLELPIFVKSIIFSFDHANEKNSFPKIKNSVNLCHNYYTSPWNSQSFIFMTIVWRMQSIDRLLFGAFFKSLCCWSRAGSLFVRLGNSAVTRLISKLWLRDNFTWWTDISVLGVAAHCKLVPVQVHEEE